MGTEARIYELEERAIEIPQSEQQRENTLKKNLQRAWRTSGAITKDIKSQKERKWAQNQLHKIMDEKLLANLGKGHNLYI